MKSAVVERVVRSFIYSVVLLATALLILPASSISAEKERVLKVRFDGKQLSVNAVNVEAEQLLRAIADEAKFKLTTSGFSQSVKADVSFDGVPLNKGIDRVIRALRSKANVSHLAVFGRKEGRDILYSLRVTYSGGKGEGRPPALPAPRPQRLIKRPRPSTKKRAALKEKREEAKRELRKEIELRIIKQLRQEGLSKEEIMDHLQKLLKEKE